MHTSISRSNGGAAEPPLAVPAAVALPSVVQEFRMMAIDSIWPSLTNPRKRFDPGSLAELADSIRAHGVLQPILVRPSEMQDGSFEIVAGERRWRAARLAGLVEIPVRVRELDDRSVLEIQTIENLQREDVHPLEEAAGFEALIPNYAYTPGQIAEKIGCHESYVQKRLRLAKLILPARQAFADGELTLNHALLLARLEPESQRHAFDLCWQEAWGPVTGKRSKQLVPAKALDSRIREQIFLDLSTAPWKRDDAQLLPKAGPCADCSKRTGANGLLFDDAGKKTDHCLDRGCFEAKREALIQIKIATAAAEGQRIVRVSNGYADDKTLKKLEAVREYTYTKVTKKDRCAHAETAIVVYGTDIGQTFEICRESKCKTHHPYGVGTGGYSRSPQEIAAERKRKLEERVATAFRRALWSQVWKASSAVGQALERDAIGMYLIERIGHDARKAVCDALDLAPQNKPHSGFGSDYEGPLQSFYQELAAPDRWRFLVALVTAPALTAYGENGESFAQLKALAKAYNVDATAIRKEIAAPLLGKFKKAEESRKAKAAEERKAARAKAAAQ